MIPSGSMSNSLALHVAEVYKALDQQAAHIVAIKQVSLGGLHSGDISCLAQ